MNLSRHAPSPARYVGIGLVVAVHLAALYALSAGLMKTPPRAHQPTEFKPLPPDLPLPKAPVEPLQAEQPRFSQPNVIQIPVPDVVVEATTDAPPLRTAPLRPDATVPSTPGTPRVDTPPAVTHPPQIRAPGAVCAVMPQPEVPAVNWTGEAVLQVVATVRGGRVVGTEFRTVQGALDAKTRRALQRSVETALSGYQCQGEAVFQQDFAFRID